MLKAVVYGGGGGGTGTVTTVSVVTANGFAGTVANATSTPAITLSTTITGLLAGDGTVLKQAVSGTDIKTVNSTSLVGSGDISVVPYTGAISDVDLGAYNLSAKGLLATGTGGAGNVNLKHQSADATATGTTTAIFADTNGDFKTKNSVGYYTTYKTSLNTADRVYTFQDKSYTVADNADLALKQDLLVSGTNIKTINGSSVLGSGDLVISGGTAIGLVKMVALGATL